LVGNPPSIETLGSRNKMIEGTATRRIRNTPLTGGEP
jgi:hypothetical protein